MDLKLSHQRERSAKVAQQRSIVRRGGEEGAICYTEAVSHERVNFETFALGQQREELSPASKTAMLSHLIHPRR